MSKAADLSELAAGLVLDLLGLVIGLPILQPIRQVEVKAIVKAAISKKLF